VKLRLQEAVRAILMAACSAVLLLAIWQVASLFTEDLPGPVRTLPVLLQMLRNPIYDNGPNDKGIGVQLLLSLSRVFAGWMLGLLIAVPGGVALGLSRRLMALLNPLMQVMRPISPLAWFPIGLAVLRSSPKATIFVIAITSLWPALLNTLFGVSAVPLEYRNVSRVFRFSRWQYVTRIALPHSLPHIATGMRLSMGIAWLVIVAAEMLAGGTGIGYFIWDSFNSLSMPRVISAIIIIGLVGLVLDRGLAWLAARAEYATWAVWCFKTWPSRSRA
jgi:nitrate/nitrite transport system permease protein